MSPFLHLIVHKKYLLFSNSFLRLFSSIILIGAVSWYFWSFDHLRAPSFFRLCSRNKLKFSKSSMHFLPLWTALAVAVECVCWQKDNSDWLNNLKEVGAKKVFKRSNRTCLLPYKIASCWLSTTIFTSHFFFRIWGKQLSNKISKDLSKTN